jgi:hypothetical protein
MGGNMSTRTMSGVDIHTDECDDHRHIAFTFGGGVTIGELADALRSAPRDAMIEDVCVSYFSGADDCEGKDLPDEDHGYPVASVSTTLEVA